MFVSLGKPIARTMPKPVNERTTPKPIKPKTIKALLLQGTNEVWSTSVVRLFPSQDIKQQIQAVLGEEVQLTDSLPPSISNLQTFMCGTSSFKEKWEFCGKMLFFGARCQNDPISLSRSPRKRVLKALQSAE